MFLFPALTLAEGLCVLASIVVVRAVRTDWRPTRGLITVRNKTVVPESRKGEGERLLGQDWKSQTHSWVNRDEA